MTAVAGRLVTTTAPQAKRMTELGDRLVILVIAVTGLLVLGLGWAGGLIEAEASALGEVAMFGGLALLVVLIVVGLWKGFDKINSRPD